MNPRPQTLVCLLLMLLVASCAPGTDGNTMTKDQARTKTHELTDALAQRVGTNPQPGGDGTRRGLGARPSYSYTYDVTVDIPSGTIERIRAELLDDLRDQGWTVHDDPMDNPQHARFRFLKPEENLSMGITVTQDQGYAVVNSTAVYKE